MTLSLSTAPFIFSSRYIVALFESVALSLIGCGLIGCNSVGRVVTDCAINGASPRHKKRGVFYPNQ